MFLEVLYFPLLYPPWLPPLPRTDKHSYSSMSSLTGTIQLFSCTQAGWPLLQYRNFHFGIYSFPKMRIATSHDTHLWQHLLGLRNELGRLVVCLSVYMCTLRIAKAFPGAPEKAKETLRLTFFISSLWPLLPSFFWFSAQGRVNKWKTEATPCSQTFLPNFTLTLHLHPESRISHWVLLKV